MKPLVFDATPLIYLNRAGLGWALEEFQEEKFTVPKVKEQVIDEGKRISAPDAFAAEKLISARKLRVREPSDPETVKLFSGVRGLHEGEKEVLALAKEINGVAITDDNIARSTARIYGVEAHGTLYLLMRLFHRGRLKKREVVDAVDFMISEGWRIGAREYSRILRETAE